MRTYRQTQTQNGTDRSMPSNSIYPDTRGDRRRNRVILCLRFPRNDPGNLSRRTYGYRESQKTHPLPVLLQGDGQNGRTDEMQSGGQERIEDQKKRKYRERKREGKEETERRHRSTHSQYTPTRGHSKRDQQFICIAPQ